MAAYSFKLHVDYHNYRHEYKKRTQITSEQLVSHIIDTVFDEMNKDRIYE